MSDTTTDTDHLTPPALLATSTDAELGARVRELVAERDRARFAYAASQRAQEEAEEARHAACKAYQLADRALADALSPVVQP